MVTLNIERSTRAFVAEIETIVRRAALEAVHDVLRGRGVPRRKRAAAPVSSTTGARRAAGGGEVATAILDYVRANPGAKMGLMAAATGRTRQQLRKGIAALVAAQRLRRVGEKRGTRYYLGPRA